MTYFEQLRRDQRANSERRRRTVTPLDRTRERLVRSSLRLAARRNIGMWESELEQRVGDVGYKIRPPAPREKLAKRVGDGYRSTQGGSYDWFYELHPAEQRRIRDNWMSDHRSVTGGYTAATVDEIEEKIPIHQWLQTTRAIDMAKALQTGRRPAADRYGGQKPESLIEHEPYELAELHHREPDRRARHVAGAIAGRKTGHKPKNPHNVRRGIAYKADGTLDVQFFTDVDGIVHPIRASYEEMTAAERQQFGLHAPLPEGHRYFNRAYGRYEEHAPSFDPDEAF